MKSKPFSLDFDVNGKTVIITGAASGIGFATAHLFAERGAKVCMVDVNQERGAALARSLNGAEFYSCDISNQKNIQSAVEEIARTHELDILVNCAGIGTIEWAKDFIPSDFERVIKINLEGTFFMSQAVGKKMIEQKDGGKIISVASQAGVVSIDKHVAYSASKAAIISMTKSLAYEWGKYGIQVNAVSPTATETPLIVGYWDQGEVHEKAIENTPAGRFCKPEEVAILIFFLATDAANMITGANILIDGGYTIH